MNLLLIMALAAHADIGPAPSCPEGTHSAYLYGRRCVRDGYHLEAKEGGDVEEVADVAPVAPTPTSPVEPVPAAPVPSNPETIAEVPASPAAPAEVAESRCAAVSSASGLSILVALGLVARRRRVTARSPRS